MSVRSERDVVVVLELVRVAVRQMWSDDLAMGIERGEEVVALVDEVARGGDLG